MKLPRTRKEILSLAAFGISILLFVWAFQFRFYVYSAPGYDYIPDRALSFKDFMLFDLDGIVNLFNPMLWTCNLGLFFLWWSYLSNRRMGILTAFAAFCITGFLLGASSLIRSRHYDDAAYLWLASFLFAGLATQGNSTPGMPSSQDCYLDNQDSPSVRYIARFLEFLQQASPPLPVGLLVVSQLAAFLEPQKPIDFPELGIFNSLGIITPFFYPLKDCYTYVAISIVTLWLLSLFLRRTFRWRVSRGEGWVLVIIATVSLIAHGMDNRYEYLSGGAFLWLMSVYTGAAWAYHGHPRNSKEIQWRY